MSAIRIISLLLVMLITSPSYCQNCNLFCNADFENPTITSAPFFATSPTLPCWQTTASDSLMELWDSGFNGVPAYSGNQFMEMEAYKIADVYQDVNLVAGDLITIAFAHRARVGIDTLSVSVALLNNAPVILGYYADTDTAWGYYTTNYSVAVNGQYRISFNTVFADGNNSGLGNLLDAVAVCSSPVGFNEINDKSALSVYPNPARSEIIIKPLVRGNGEVKIYNMLGWLVYNEKVNDTTEMLKIDGLKKGVYSVQLKIETTTAAATFVIH